MHCGQPLPSSIMEDAGSLYHEEESEDMLRFLLAGDGCPIPGKQEEWEVDEAFGPCKLEGMEYEACGAIPPIYPTFDCDTHNPFDPRSVSAFLPSSEEETPPTSPGASSSPDIARSELYDDVIALAGSPVSEDESSDDGFSTNNLLDNFSPSSDLGATIVPTVLLAGSVGQPDNLLPAKQEKAKATRKRKRARKTGDEPAIQTAVTLPRQQLLTLSSKELDDYAARLRATRPLTPAEEKDLRRQRRLIKNRESASLSRQRRKEHIDVLEAQVAQLNAENEQLKAQVQYLSSENAALKERLRQQPGGAVVPQSPSLGERLKKMTKINSSPFSGMNAAAAGTCLAIVLFSFGLMFNAPFQGDMAALNGGLYTAATTHQPLVIDTLAPPTPVSEAEIASIAKAAKSSPSSKGYDFPEWRIRKPLEMEEGSASMPIDVDVEESFAKPVIMAKKTATISSFTSSAPRVEESVRMQVDQTAPLSAGEPEPTNGTNGRFDEDKHILASLKGHHNHQYITHTSTEPYSNNHTHTKEDSNTTSGYLICPQVQPVWAPEHASKRIEPDTLLTLLLPAGSLGVPTTEISGQQSALLQVLCHVKDVRAVCLNLQDSPPTAIPCSSS